MTSSVVVLERISKPIPSIRGMASVARQNRSDQDGSS
ncbi:hypothetical protein PI125_g19306 [Phytophthora idaei]|nr:hypothetical protein PI125_g19306 [Phytophthora idaei]